jgi:fructose-1,6-bisphosphatase/sedoheptulose 1,7-bisphosphatase-like protein
MKGQVHNQGELKELKVEIEKQVVEAMEQMSENTGYSLGELVVIALKRFRASHSDYEKKTMSLD